MLKTTLRSLWAHKRRLLSTVLSVVLGVAFMAGTLVLGDTMNANFDQLFADVNEHVDAEVRGPELFDTDFGGVRGRVDESVETEVRGVDGVAAAEGFLMTEAVTVLGADGEPLGGQGPPTLLESWIDDDLLNAYDLAEGRAPESAAEAAMNVAAAEEGGYEVGDEVAVLAEEGRLTYTLVGTYTLGGADSAAGSISISVPRDEAQRLAGMPGQLDVVVARGEEGVSQEELVERIASTVPDDLEVVTGEQSSEDQAESLQQGLSFFTQFLLIFAFIALGIGSFIIYNTFSILVAQRARELALLRAVGASRRQVLGSVLVEAVVVGIVAAGLGLLAGIALAVALQAALDALGVDLPTAGTVVSGGTVVAAVLTGLVITFLSVLLPAWRASKVPPIAALREVAHDTSGTSKVRAAIGVVLLVLSVLAAIPAFGDAPDTQALQMVGLAALLALVGVIVLGPVLARPGALLLGRALGFAGMTGTLARENAARSPKRTASTAAALMIGVALVGFITVFASSAQASIDREVSRGFLGDFVVQTGQLGAGVSPELAEELRDVEGVATVAATRFGPAQLTLPDGDTTGTFIGAGDPEALSDVLDARMAQGQLSDLDEDGILVDQAVAEDRGLEIGDEITVLFASGESTTVTVAGLADDPAMLGQWFVALDTFAAGAPQQLDRQLLLQAEEGADLEALEQRIEEVADAYPVVDVLDRDAFIGSIADQITQVLNIVYALLALSVIIALIGIANTLSLSIHERTRELGLLRAVGMTRRQLRATVRWEAVIIALIGTVLGLVLGLVFSFVLVQALSGQGFSEYRLPVVPLVVVVVVFAMLGVLASVRPARRAARLDVLEAIAAE